MRFPNLRSGPDRTKAPTASEICSSILRATSPSGFLGGVGGQSISRYRAAEFEQKDGADASTLLDNLEAVLRQADSVLADVTAKDLERSIVIQGRETTVLGAVYHVVEHFAMHTGQIILLTKTYAPGKIDFYEDADGLAQPTWHRGTALDEAAH